MMLAIATTVTLAGCTTVIDGRPRQATGAVGAPSGGSPSGFPSDSGAVSPSSAAASGDLSTRILPAPEDFAVSTDPNADNGPITTADFDSGRSPGSPTAAESGFVLGYAVTYDTVDTSPTTESLAIALLRFTSASAASDFASSATPDDSLDPVAPRKGTLPDIPRSVTIDTTKPDTDGTFDHVVFASKGTLVMAIDLTDDQAGPTPGELQGWAIDQYKRI